VPGARHRTDATTWRIRPRALVALVVASAGLAASVWLTGGHDSAEASVPHSVFSDDFSGVRDSGLDTSKWLLDGDTGNGRLDGSGKLEVNRLMSTRKAFAEPFGHAEARIKVSREVGVWRAFGVVDKYGRVLRGKVEQLNKGADPTDGDDFHTYTIDWSPSAILWSVDGVPSLRQTPQERGLPLAIVLNLATDGHRPVRMSVDFVHVTAGAKAPVSTPSASPSSSASPQAAAWKTYTNYHAGDLVTFGGATYRVKEDHTALPAWTPKAVPDLFEKV
jgi:hypothetical protein